MSFALSQRSLGRLAGVHPELVTIVKRAIAITKTDFAITEGVRTYEKQREYFLLGKSRTMKSRHLTGHAVDLMPCGDLDRDGDVDGIDLEQTWEKQHFLPLNDAMQEAAARIGVPIVWGGHWGWDFPHFEIDPAKYPNA